MYYILIFILIVIIFGIFLILKFSKNKKLCSKTKKELEKNFKHIKSSTSSKERITDFDKLYHKILLKLGYNGTFGEILKSKPRVISDINKIWELHKLRNKLVHDFDLISENILKKKALEYEENIIKLLKNN